MTLRADLSPAYKADLAHYGTDPMDRKAEREVFGRLAAGDESAREEVALANLRFVIQIARQYEGKGVDLADLIAEGNTGLLEAIDRFDITRGFKFISYAVWWIRQRILRALAEQHTIRRPMNTTVDARALDIAADDLTRDLGRDPRHEDVAEAAGLSADRAESAFRGKIPEARLDRRVSADPAASILSDLIGYHPPAPDIHHDTAHLYDALETLDSREQEIVQLYFGLDDEPPMTLEQIGDRLCLTRERIRQIKERALDKLSRNTALQEIVA